MASTDPELRRREAHLARRAGALSRRERELAAREAELTARRSRRAVACRLAFAPLHGLRLVAGVWLLAGATALGGTVLLASAVACGVLLIASALAELAGCEPPPGERVASRWRRWLGPRLPLP